MNILVCDDQFEHARVCKSKVLEVAERHGIDVKVDIASSGKNLLFFLDTKYKNIDLIYMDIHMPELDGIETAKKLREKQVNAEIVFYTADPNYALKAFDVQALHYIIKEEHSDEQFEEIFMSACQRCNKKKTEVLSLSCAGERRNVPIDRIQYFEVQSRIVTVYYMEQGQEQRFEFYSTLSKIQEVLRGKGFIRIHSSYLVSEAHIVKKLVTKVLLDHGIELPVGRSYRKKI